MNPSETEFKIPYSHYRRINPSVMVIMGVRR